VPPENTVPQFAGAHPVGGPKRAAAAPEEFWTKSVEDRTGDGRAQFKLHVRNFLDCVKSRQEPVSDLESAHRVATVFHLANIALRVGRRVRWDAKREEIIDDPAAAKMLSREYRAPWDKELKAVLS
jgi:hypothetical protein